LDITITGRHQHLDEKVRTYIHEKLQRILRLHNRLSTAHVILDQEHGRHTAEVMVNGTRGAVFTARAEGTDLRSVVDAAEAKLEHQIRQWKGRLVDHRPS
jgi:ribosomal subunit interface protein